jgi:type VI secretion system secreted protein VgrG
LNVGGSSIQISAAGIKFSGPTVSVNGSAVGGDASAASPSPPESAQAPKVVEPPVDPIS